MMRRYYNPFWMGFTIVLSVILAVIAFPIFMRRYGPFLGFFFTVIGLALIWLRYIFIAWLFTRGERICLMTITKGRSICPLK